MVKIEHTGPEFCTYCYYRRYVEIKMKWERREEACTNKAKKHGYTPAQVEVLRGRIKREMKKEIVNLDEEWEDMCSA